MLEIAGDILLAVLILNVLVCLGPFFMVVSAILSWVFMVGVGGGIVWFLCTYLDLFSASLVVATVATAIAGFGSLWRRFILIYETPPQKWGVAAVLCRFFTQDAIRSDAPSTAAVVRCKMVN